MKRSNLGMPLKALVLSSILGVSQVSVATPLQQWLQETAPNTVNIKSPQIDNKGPLSPTLTMPTLKSPPTSKPSFKVDASQATLDLMGGVGDGGGNAVGKTLFDFYENEGTIKVSIAQLMSLEPQVQQLIQLLNQQVPKIKDVTGPSFGDVVAQSLKNKKIIIDRKAINSQACVNQSMVSTTEQVVVACQSDNELRINAQWLKAADSKNRAALILHEMILGWFRAEFQNRFDKTTLEKKVRELVRDIFSYPSVDIANAITESTGDGLTGVKAYSGKNYALLATLPEKIKNVYETFCRNPQQGPATLMPEYFENDFLYNEINAEVKMMQQYSDMLKGGRRTSDALESYYRRVAGYCRVLTLDKAPIRTPVKTDITPQCQDSIDFKINLYVSDAKANLAQSDLDKQWKLIRLTQEIITKSETCAEQSADYLNGLANAANYAKWRLNQEFGIEVSFVRSKAVNWEDRWISLGTADKNPTGF
jgi:hypothetical protein